MIRAESAVDRPPGVRAESSRPRDGSGRVRVGVVPTVPFSDSLIANELPLRRARDSVCADDLLSELRVEVTKLLGPPRRWPADLTARQILDLQDAHCPAYEQATATVLARRRRIAELERELAALENERRERAA